MLSPGTPTAPKAIESALCTRDLLIYDAHGEAKGLTASSPSGTGNKLPRTPSGWQSATP
jgi:hypothetical protein